MGLVFNTRDRKDYISADKQSAISADGEIFHVGDVVAIFADGEIFHVGDALAHESVKGELAIIESFYIDATNNDVRANTTRGNAAIVFLYKNN